MPLFKQSPTHYKLAHRNAAGEIIWEQGWTGNAMADEGEENILDIIYRGATAPTNFFLRLYNTTPTDTSTLTGISGSEAAGGGYSALTVNRDATDFPTLALDSGDFKVTSKTFQWTATSGFGPVTYLILATTSNNSGKLYNYVALSATRTLAASEKLDVTIAVKAS